MIVGVPPTQRGVVCAASYEGAEVPRPLRYAQRHRRSTLPAGRVGWLFAEQPNNAREALGHVVAELINPKAADLPAEALELKVSPVVVVLAAAPRGSVH